GARPPGGAMPAWPVRGGVGTGPWAVTCGVPGVCGRADGGVVGRGAAGVGGGVTAAGGVAVGSGGAAIDGSGAAGRGAAGFAARGMVWTLLLSGVGMTGATGATGAATTLLPCLARWVRASTWSGSRLLSWFLMS